MTVSVIEESIYDGAYRARVNVAGVEFSAVYGPEGQPRIARTANDGVSPIVERYGRKAAEAFVKERVAGMPTAWHIANRKLGKM